MIFVAKTMQSHTEKFVLRETHDIAIAMSRSFHADSGLRVAFKCLNQCHCPDCLANVNGVNV